MSKHSVGSSGYLLTLAEVGRIVGAMDTATGWILGISGIVATFAYLKWDYERLGAAPSSSKVKEYAEYWARSRAHDRRVKWAAAFWLIGVPLLFWLSQ